MVDSSAKLVEKGKSQHEYAAEKVKRENKAREDQPKELSICAKTNKAVDVTITRDFDEDTCTESTQGLMIET